MDQFYRQATNENSNLKNQLYPKKFSPDNMVKNHPSLSKTLERGGRWGGSQLNRKKDYSTALCARAYPIPHHSLPVSRDDGWENKCG